MSELDVQLMTVVGLFMLMMLICGIFIGGLLEQARRRRQKSELVAALRPLPRL